MDTFGKKWPEIRKDKGTEWLGPDQSVGDTQEDGMEASDTQGVLGWRFEVSPDPVLDYEASIDKKYFMGMDIGFGRDTTVTAIGHIDTEGVMVIDQILDDGFRVPANQGL